MYRAGVSLVNRWEISQPITAPRYMSVAKWAPVSILVIAHPSASKSMRRLVLGIRAASIRQPPKATAACEDGSPRFELSVKPERNGRKW